MAVADSFLTFVLEQLAGVRDVSWRRMFGGIGLYSGEWFFAVIDNDTLFFKVDGSSRERYRRRKMPPFRPDPKGPAMEGYYQVPPSVLEDDDELARWATDAVGISRAARRTKRR